MATPFGILALTFLSVAGRASPFALFGAMTIASITASGTPSSLSCCNAAGVVTKLQTEDFISAMMVSGVKSALIILITSSFTSVVVGVTETFDCWILFAASCWGVKASVGT